MLKKFRASTTTQLLLGELVKELVAHPCPVEMTYKKSSLHGISVTKTHSTVRHFPDIRCQ
jgi:hypothetical protein